MPELPEVETMVRGLRPQLEGRSIASIEVRDPRVLEKGLSAQRLIEESRGARVASVFRRGKWVVVASDRGTLVVQPRMTGGFWLVPPEGPQHVRMVLTVEGSGPIWWKDARCLSKVAWHATESDAEGAFARSQGPDALTIALDDLAVRLKATRRAIKPTIMDQKVLAGVGNIYADEALHSARLHPGRPSDGLAPEEVQRLHRAVRETLERAIAAEGSSFDAGYRTVLGLEGGFLASNATYGRTGEPCRECGAPIVRSRLPGLLGRSTHHCPNCQPALLS